MTGAADIELGHYAVDRYSTHCICGRSWIPDDPHDWDNCAQVSASDLRPTSDLLSIENLSKLWLSRYSYVNHSIHGNHFSPNVGIIVVIKNFTLSFQRFLSSFRNGKT